VHLVSSRPEVLIDEGALVVRSSVGEEMLVWERKAPPPRLRAV
jgi:hypothetical protein